MRHIIRDVLHRSLLSLYEAWDAARGDGRMPTRAALAEFDLERWRDDLLIIQPMADGGWRYGRYGQTFIKRFGLDLTGQTVASSLIDDQRVKVEFDYEHACDEKKAVWRVYKAQMDNHSVTWQRLILPVSDDGEAVIRLLVGIAEIRK
jgi:hypothetical protein